MLTVVGSIEVHLTGGSSWWHELIGPFLLAVTAILAAVIAAKTANKRQGEQLLHDRNLQADRLAHDRKLQAGQLAYDREQHNREHVRDRIDSAVLMVDQAVRTYTEYQREIRHVAALRSTLQAVADNPSAKAEEYEEADSLLQDQIGDLRDVKIRAQTLSAELVSEGVRLSLRLGTNSSIFEAHKSFRQNYSARIDYLAGLGETPSSGEVEGENVDGMKSIERVAAEFLAECRAWFEEEQKVPRLDPQ